MSRKIDKEPEKLKVIKANVINELKIQLWGEVVGYAAYSGNNKLIHFEYDNSFPLKYDLSPLMMPRNKQRSWSFDLNEATYLGLPGLLADSLPDSYGQQMIDTWFAKQGLSLGNINTIDKLCYLGSRGMGALEFFPNQDLKIENQEIDISKLVELSASILEDRKASHASLKEISTVLQIGSSAGGARAKAVVALNPDTEEIRSGQVENEKGFEHWIIKLDSISNKSLNDPLGYTNIEYAYYLMALDSGIEMMPSKLYSEQNRFHFLTKRFDRSDDGEKVHMQTLCGLAHLDYKQARSSSYDTIFKIANFLRLSMMEKEQLFKRMVFNVLARNCDDHTKNFSFLMDKNAQWKLAPAYDITFAYNPDNFWLKEHNQLINGKSKDICREDFLVIAKNFNIKNANLIIDKINSTLSNWLNYAQEAQLSIEKAEYINKQLIRDM